jgi:hypothetical protein
VTQNRPRLQAALAHKHSSEAIRTCRQLNRDAAKRACVQTVVTCFAHPGHKCTKVVQAAKQTCREAVRKSTVDRCTAKVATAKRLTLKSLRSTPVAVSVPLAAVPSNGRTLPGPTSLVLLAGIWGLCFTLARRVMRATPVRRY